MAKLKNKEKVIELLKSVETGEEGPVAYINPEKYIQHNLAVKDGLEGFGELLENQPEEGFKVDVVRAFEDGDKVFTQTKYDFFGPKIGFDIFRFEDGLIVEHWDNLIEIFEETTSGRTQIDGTTTIIDKDKTESNKHLVKEFYENIFINGDYDDMPRFFDGDNYLQHNPQIPDGVSGLTNALAEMAKQGMIMDIEKLHYILGEGNFVLAVGEGTFGEKPTAFYDLFRVENNKIAEHWDVMSEIPPKNEWQNSNGKF